MTEFAAGTWYPIETAPKDGDDIDVWADLGNGLGNRVPYVWWANNFEKWFHQNKHGEIVMVYGTVTHWTPIPGKPKEA